MKELWKVVYRISRLSLKTEGSWILNRDECHSFLCNMGLEFGEALAVVYAAEEAAEVSMLRGQGWAALVDVTGGHGHIGPDFYTG